MKNLRHIFLLLVVAECVFSVIAHAQENIDIDKRQSYGLTLGANLNVAYGSFTQLPGIPDCNSLYTNGTGFGPSAGVFYKFPLQNNFSLSLHGIYSSQRDMLNSDELLPLSVKGNLIEATDRHSLSVSLGSIAFRPIAEYEIMKNLSLYGGGQIGYFIKHSFDQTETIIDPIGGVFTENNLATRNHQSGNIPAINKVNAALIFGAGYELPLNKDGSIKAVPQLIAAIGITPIVEGINWRENSFSASVGIEFTSPKPIPPAVIIPPPPPATIIPPPLAARIHVVGLANDGTESANAIVLVEEFYGKNMAPILPYVFYDENSSDLPSRLHILSSEETSNFSEGNITTSNALDSYKETLNILGKRLLAKPKAPVVLTGIALFPNETDLARQRAEHLKDYFTDIWGIPSERFVIRTQFSPDPGNLDSDIIQEEHRVEIQSNEPGLLDPLTTYDTLRSATPPSIRLYPTLTAIQPLRNWRITISQNGEMLESFEARDSSLPISIDWRFKSSSMPKYPGNLDIALSVTDTLGRSNSESATIRVEQLTLGKKKALRIADHEIQKYNLIVFDRGSAVLSAQHKRIIEKIRKEVRPNSIATISGYTDRVGDELFNKKLSEERASVVGKSLGISNMTTRGFGKSALQYSNDVPEGRFFCRTVVVTIETPDKSQ